MLQLDEPVDTEGSYIKAACLPRKNEDLIGNENCWISGWGETRAKSGMTNYYRDGVCK